MRTDINWTPFDKEEISATTGAAVGLTAQKLANIKGSNNLYLTKVLVTTYPVAWQENGATATGTDANVTNPGDLIILESYLAMKNFSAIGVGGTAVLAVTYYRAC